MKIPIVKIYHSIRSGNTFLDPVQIDNFYGLRVSLSSDRSKDSFNFNVINHRERQNDIVEYTRSGSFSKQDKVSIYAYYKDEYAGTGSDGLPDSSHFLISGFISDVDYSRSENLASFSIKGVSVSEGLMNVLVPAIYLNDNVSNIVLDLVNKANGTMGDDRKITASLAVLDGSNNRISGGYIWPTKNDGTAFKTISFTKNYSNIFNHLSTLSAVEYTGDTDIGTYIFYLDSNNELHFEPKKLVTNKSFDEYLDDVSNIGKRDTKDGMINVVLFNSGRDPYGNGILTISHNITSVKKYGAKWKYLTEDRVSTYIQNKESELSGGIDPETKFPTAGTYPYTVQQSGSFLGKTYISGVTTVADNSEYKDYIRTIVSLEGKSRAKLIVDETGNPRDEVQWDFDLGNNLYQPNDLWDIQLYSIDYNKKLRVNKIDHSFTNGWDTNITLRQDEKDLSYL